MPCSSRKTLTGQEIAAILNAAGPGISREMHPKHGRATSSVASGGSALHRLGDCPLDTEENLAELAAIGTAGRYFARNGGRNFSREEGEATPSYSGIAPACLFTAYRPLKPDLPDGSQAPEP